MWYKTGEINWLTLRDWRDYLEDQFDAYEKEVSLISSTASKEILDDLDAWHNDLLEMWEDYLYDFQMYCEYCHDNMYNNPQYDHPRIEKPRIEQPKVVAEPDIRIICF
jgi:hypothetical protein